MPRRTEEHITGEAAIDLLRSMVPSEWILRQQPEADYGIDAELEIVSEQEVSGALLKAQVRGTRSNRPWKLPIKLQWLRYWSEMTVPVILFRGHLPSAELRWLDIATYVQDRGLEWWVGGGEKRRIVDFSNAPSLQSSIDELREIAFEARQQAVTSREQWNGELRAIPILFAILIEKFGEDFDEWLRWLRVKGSDNQIIDDFPMVYEWKQRCDEDLTLMEKIRIFHRTWRHVDKK